MVAGIGTVVYPGVILAAGLADFMRDAPPLAWMALAGIVPREQASSCGSGPGVRAAFDRD